MVGLKSEQRTIGDAAYRVTQLPVGKARKVFVRLVKLVGPSLGKLIEGVDAAGSKGKVAGLADLDVRFVSAAFETFATTLSEEDLEFVVDQVLGGGMVEFSTDGDKWPKLTKEVADLHFAGKLHEYFRLLAFALEVNFGGFLGVLGTVGTKVAAAMSAATPAPSSSSPPT